MKIKRDQITGLVLMLAGVILAVMISQFETPFTPEYPGPKLFPGIGAFGLFVCGLGVFISGCRQKDADAIFVTRKGWINIIVSFIALCVYVFAMKYVGFLVASPIILYFLCTYFAKESGIKTRLWVRIVFAIAVTAAIYGMYVPLFGMSLPAGLLFE